MQESTEIEDSEPIVEEKQPPNKAIRVQQDLFDQTAINEPVLIGEADSLEQSTMSLETVVEQSTQISGSKVEPQTISETEVLTIRQSHSQKVKFYSKFILGRKHHTIFDNTFFKTFIRMTPSWTFHNL
jgi:hypothetical protein